MSTILIPKAVIVKLEPSEDGVLVRFDDEIYPIFNNYIIFFF